MLLLAAAAALQNEPQLLQMLDEVRQGLFSHQTRQILTCLQRPLTVDDGIEPTELFPKNELVSCERTRWCWKLERSCVLPLWCNPKGEGVVGML
jgi:hypothetical protein